MHEPLASFKKVDSIWEKLSEGHKILAQYTIRANQDQREMALQKRRWKTYKGRDIYIRLFHELYFAIQNDSLNKTLGKFFYWKIIGYHLVHETVRWQVYKFLIIVKTIFSIIFKISVKV